MESEAQTVPVRIYQAENQIMLAAPMPGLEAQDISVSISDKKGHHYGPGARARATQRGTGGLRVDYRSVFSRDYLRSSGEWTFDQCNLREWRVGSEHAKGS